MPCYAVPCYAVLCYATRCCAGVSRGEGHAGEWAMSLSPSEESFPDSIFPPTGELQAQVTFELCGAPVAGSPFTVQLISAAEQRARREAAERERRRGSIA